MLPAEETYETESVCRDCDTRRNPCLRGSRHPHPARAGVHDADRRDGGAPMRRG